MKSQRPSVRFLYNAKHYQKGHRKGHGQAKKNWGIAKTKRDKQC